LIGACGGVGTTAVLGLAALRRGLTDHTSMVTALPLFDALQLDRATSFVVGGHDVRRSSFVEAACELHLRSNVFHPALIDGCRSDLEAWAANIRPGTIHNAGAAISKLADLPEAQRGDNPRQTIERIQKDLRSFRDSHKLDQVVVMNVAS